MSETNILSKNSKLFLFDKEKVRYPGFVRVTGLLRDAGKLYNRPIAFQFWKAVMDTAYEGIEIKVVPRTIRPLQYVKGVFSSKSVNNK